MQEPNVSALSATKTVTDPARAFYFRQIVTTKCDINVLLLFTRLAENDHDCEVRITIYCMLRCAIGHFRYSQVTEFA